MQGLWSWNIGLPDSLFWSGKSGTTQILRFVGVITLLLVMGILQDYLEARLRGFSFYFSESLLFKAYLIPAVPLFILLYRTAKQIRKSVKSCSVPAVCILTLFAVFAHLLLFAGVVHVISLLIFDHAYSFAGLFEEVLAEDVYKYGIAYGVLTSLLLIYSPVKKTTEFRESVRLAEMLTVSSGKANTAITIADIHYVVTDHPYLAICTGTSRHLYSGSLKALREKLDAGQFIQVHRSALINIRYVKSYHSRLNGDYDITMQGGQVIRMSRNFAKEFKSLLA